MPINADMILKQFEKKSRSNHSHPLSEIEVRGFFVDITVYTARYHYMMCYIVTSTPPQGLGSGSIRYRVVNFRIGFTRPPKPHFLGSRATQKRLKSVTKRDASCVKATTLMYTRLKMHVQWRICDIQKKKLELKSSHFLFCGSKGTEFPRSRGKNSGTWGRRRGGEIFGHFSFAQMFFFVVFELPDMYTTQKWLWD